MHVLFDHFKYVFLNIQENTKTPETNETQIGEESVPHIWCLRPEVGELKAKRSKMRITNLEKILFPQKMSNFFIVKCRFSVLIRRNLSGAPTEERKEKCKMVRRECHRTQNGPAIGDAGPKLVFGLYAPFYRPKAIQNQHSGPLKYAVSSWFLN